MSRNLRASVRREQLRHVRLTKTDKIKASELAAVAEKTAAEANKHVAACPEIHLASSEKGTGIAALRAAVVADALGEGWMG